MAKKFFCALLALVLLLTASAALAEMYADEYADVPSVMTQDSFHAFTAEPAGQVEILQPDPDATALLEQIYDFVWHQKNRPVRFYDEATQQKIAALADGMDIDSLYMTEFAGVQLSMAADAPETITLRMTLEPEYFPGQLIIVVMCRREADGAWTYFPYRGHVPENGVITYDMPAEDFLALTPERTVLHVLTVRPGPGGTETRSEIISYETVIHPSKTAADITKVIEWRSVTGEALEDHFRIFFVDLTDEMKTEMANLADFLTDGNNAIAYFPANVRQQAEAAHPALSIEDMVIYDVAAVMAENYHETYGDVATENRFPTAYQQEKATFALLGLWRADAEAPGFEWYYLRADALETDGDLEIVYQQLVIPDMEEQPAFLVIFSEVLTEEEAK